MAARLAGADGVVRTSAALGELCGALRRVGRGGHVLPAIPVTQVRELAASLAPEDLPMLGMASNGVPVGEIAAVLGSTEHHVRSRLVGMVRTLSIPRERRTVPRC